MKHWYWCRITRGDEEIDTLAYRVESILTAHGLEVDIGSSEPEKGKYLVRLFEFPESIEVVAIELGVGELTVTML